MEEGNINGDDHKRLNHAPMTYRDFNLRFAEYDPENGKFKVWVEGDTPGGTMRPDDAIESVFRPTEFWENPETGTGGLAGKVARRKNLTREAMFELGELLGVSGRLALRNHRRSA